jgi:hypothetical protein
MYLKPNITKNGVVAQVVGPNVCDNAGDGTLTSFHALDRGSHVVLGGCSSRELANARNRVPDPDTLTNDLI